MGEAAYQIEGAESILQASHEHLTSSEVGGIVASNVVRLHAATEQSVPSDTLPPTSVAEGEFSPPQESRFHYPYISFTFNDEQMSGNGIVAPTNESRLRAALHALQLGWEDAPQINATELRKLHGDLYDLEKARVKISQGANGEMVKRSDLYEVEDITNAAFTHLILQNHPVAQLMEQIEQRFPEFSRVLMSELRSRLTVAVAHDEIRKAYLDTVKAKQKALSSASTRG